MLTFATATIGMMILTANIALKAITYIVKLTKIEKYLELSAGLVVFGVGLWLPTEDYLYALLGIGH